MQEAFELAKKYSPYIYFDEKEPFFPRLTGYTLFKETRPSPSFNRQIEVGKHGITSAIEYAIYWDYDITHLYELEHFWVFLNAEGEIVDAQGSFHGKHLKVLLKDRSNIMDETHVKIYSQAGKHAFSAFQMLFDYVPDNEYFTNEQAGMDGLVITDKIARGRYQTSPNINERVHSYMQKYRFTPSQKYTQEYRIKEEDLVEWSVLDDKIPSFIDEELQKMT